MSSLVAELSVAILDAPIRMVMDVTNPMHPNHVPVNLSTVWPHPCITRVFNPWNVWATD